MSMNAPVQKNAHKDSFSAQANVPINSMNYKCMFSVMSSLGCFFITFLVTSFTADSRKGSSELIKKSFSIDVKSPAWEMMRRHLL